MSFKLPESIPIPQAGLLDILGESLGQGVQTGIQSALKRKETEKSGKSLAEILGKPELATEFGNLPLEIQLRLGQELVKPRLQATDIEALRKAGLSPEEASLYAIASTGGQTEIMRDIIERRRRQEEPKENIQEQSEELIRNQDIGLTQAERVRRQNDRYKSNLPLLGKEKEKIKKLDDEERRIKFLNVLNKSDKLPKGIERINVDSKGNLRLPFLASKEAQAYVKTINDFLQGAKDSFGARVTNFEIDLFLKRLPTLWNSKEGRDYVIKKLDIVNKINQLATKGTIEGFAKGGGLRNVDFDKAQAYGEMKNQAEIDELEQKYLENEMSFSEEKPIQKRISLEEIFK